jgi:hypothetical protein
MSYPHRERREQARFRLSGDLVATWDLVFGSVEPNDASLRNRRSEVRILSGALRNPHGCWGFRGLDLRSGRPKVKPPNLLFHSDGARSAVDRGDVGRSVNARGEAADDGDPGVGQGGGGAAGSGERPRGWLTCADDRHGTHVARRNCAGDVQQRRSIGHGQEVRRIVGVEYGPNVDAVALPCVELGNVRGKVRDLPAILEQARSLAAGALLEHASCATGAGDRPGHLRSARARGADQREDRRRLDSAAGIRRVHRIL